MRRPSRGSAAPTGAGGLQDEIEAAYLAVRNSRRFCGGASFLIDTSVSMLPQTFRA